MLILYFLFAGVVSLATRLRRWQIVPQAAPSRFGDTQFGIYDLGGTMAAAGLVFGLGNWVLPRVAWPETLALWQAHLVRAFITAFVITVPCLPIIPCAIAALAPSRPGRRIAWALASAAATGTCFVIVLTSLEQQPVTSQDIAILSSVLVGGYASAMFTLFCVRFFGLRVVRRPLGQLSPAGRN